MALIAMVTYDTADNGRHEYTKRTLQSLFDTVDFSRHRLIVVDNGSDKPTVELLMSKPRIDTVIFIGENIGTAEAINLAWKEREPGEHCIKIDNDVVIHSKGWADELEEAANRENNIGLVALKRKDLMESPSCPNQYFRSELIMLHHEPGQRWIVVEKCSHIMGTCVLHSSALLNKVGYLYQIGKYGFDDSLMSLRSRVSGFMNCFLPHIEIDHIDDGSNKHTQEKKSMADKAWADVQREMMEIKSGKKSVYYNPFENE